MQAIILAAGMGKRLKHLTENNTKCMVKVNGISIIWRTLRILDRKALNKIVIVVGYEGQKLVNYIESLNVATPITYIWNNDYEKTNNIYSLSLAKEHLCEDDTILLESDLVFDEAIIDRVLTDERKSLAVVDKFESWMDGSCMIIDDDDIIVDFVPGKYFNFNDKEKYYKTVNIYKLSVDFSSNIYVPFLAAYEKAMGENEYYESVIKLIAMLETNEIRVKRIDDQKWYEIDDIQDLDIAESLFTDDPAERYRKIMSRYGGFWRYPHMTDYCYLVNPYFPPKRLLDEMESNFKTLLTQYPSGQKVDSTISSNIFGVKDEYIILGNGAAELIKALLDIQTGAMGIIEPSFNEYKNRYSGNVEIYHPYINEKGYNADDVINYFDDKSIGSLVLINPDNPTGNYIPIYDVLKLIQWAEKKQIKFILDESFVDFVDLQEDEIIEDVTLIKDDILEKHTNLYIIKSISKSYGVPGVRLGVLASADKKEMGLIRSTLPIWNINSFGEFFMQIFNKYKKNYIESMEKFRNTRRRFLMDLQEIAYLKVLPTQANYVMCEVVGIDSEQLCIRLFEEGILIKDVSGKISNGRSYIRIAVRTEKENNILIGYLTKVYNDLQNF